MPPAFAATRTLPETLSETGSVADAQFLRALGRRVRELREARTMSRKLLARDSRVSERYLGHLESGDGNISVMLLRRVAAALGVSAAELLPADERDAAGRLRARRRRVALIGLRGAGKSTLGALLAKDLRIPLVELNREVTRDTGLPVGEVIALYGQAGYRRIECKALQRVVAEHDRAVIVAGGGVVADEEAFNLLRAHCYTVWLKARPEDHMARVLAQGDTRPMAGHAEAMDDLRRILASREPLYRKADAVVETSGESPQLSLRKLRDAVAATEPKETRDG